MRKIYRYLADAKLNKSHLATSALAELKQMGGEYAARADQISQRWNIIAAIGKAMAEGRTFDDVIVSRVRKMNVRGSSDAIVRAELTAMHAIGVLKRIDGNYTMTEPGTEGKKVPVGKNSQAPERNLAKEYREACRRAEGIIQREIRDRTDRIEQKYEEKYGILWKEMAQSRSAGDAGALKELEAKALTLKRDKENELFQMEKEVRARHTLPPLAEWKG